MRLLVLFVIPCATILLVTILMVSAPVASTHAANFAVAGNTPSQTTAITRTPLIFVPGLMGSRLFNLDSGSEEEEVWANWKNILTSDLDMLRLAPDGVSPYSNAPSYTTVHTKTGIAGVVTTIEVGSIYSYNVYSATVQHFVQSHGYTEGVDFWAYPYDWRKDLRIAANDLDLLVEQIQQQTAMTQVQIVAHSMGGLVTRQYLADPVRAAKVQRAVILGTPFVGTPKGYYVLLEGDCEIDLKIICFPSEAEIKELAPNLYGFYQIFPSRSYFTVKGSGYYAKTANSDPSGDCTTCLNFTQTYTSAIAPMLNITLTAGSDQFHAGLDLPTSWNGVPVDIVGGVGQQTTVGIQEKQVWSWLKWRYVTTHVPVQTSAGDGTVARDSVSLSNPSGSVNLRGTASYTEVVSTHMELVSLPGVLAYVDERLGLPALPGMAAILWPTTGIVTGTQVIAYGASRIESYDGEGRYTGPRYDAAIDTTVIEESIPGSAYQRSDEWVSVALVGGMPYSITVVPNGANNFVDIVVLRSDRTATVSTTIFSGIEVTPTTRIYLVGDPFVVNSWETGPSESMRQGEATLLPTLEYTDEQAIDIAPPQVGVTLAGTTGPLGWYVGPVTVTLTAEDAAGGAGISRIEYGFEHDRTPRTYTGPFVVLGEEAGVLYAIATDRATNVSSAPAIVRIGPDRVWLPRIDRQGQ